jgi:hypothetical protein
MYEYTLQRGLGLCISVAEFIDPDWEIKLSYRPAMLHGHGGLVRRPYASRGSMNLATEPVFLNVYGAQESIPRNQFRQPM